MDERYYWLAFSVFSEGIGPKRFQLLQEHFGSAKSAWNATEKELQESGANIGPIIASKFTAFKQAFSIEKYLHALEEKNVTFITFSEEAYPELLKEIKNPPIVLYVKQKAILSRSLSFQDDKCVGIVGTRKITAYGRQVTEQITEVLVKAGYIVVSGLAFGVDAVAHTVTIENKGITIAVLGCGVDCCSPKENQQLYERIVEEHGSIISEYPLGANPTKGSFPSRNRIIAGLSQAVIVTEGAEDSGALYTASEALDLGRPVFAVPGPITSQLSKGPLSLVSKGAKLVTSVDDILQGLRVENGGLKVNTNTIKGETVEEQSVIDFLKNESLQFDELVKKTGFDSSKLGVLLSIMEMKGMIKDRGGVLSLER